MNGAISLLPLYVLMLCTETKNFTFFSHNLLEMCGVLPPGQIDGSAFAETLRWVAQSS
jgi:hypothetical protein